MSLESCFSSKTSRTMPFPLHWKRRPLGPEVTIPAASYRKGYWLVPLKRQQPRPSRRCLPDHDAAANPNSQTGLDRPYPWGQPEWQLKYRTWALEKGVEVECWKERAGKKFNARRRRLGVWSTTVACDLLSTGGDWTGCGAEQFVVILKLYWKGLELRRMKKFRSLNFGEKVDNSAWNADYSLSEYMTGWLPALIFVVKVTAASRVANIWMKHRCGWFLHLQIAVILDPRFRVASSQHLIAHE